jgi:hypothetical protein
MAYIGSTPTTQSFISGTDYFNGTGSQTSFTLSRPVGSVNDIQAVVNNVVQVPNDAYNVSGTSIVFTSAPSAGTGNVYVRYLSTTTQSITPSQNTVSYNTFNSDMQGTFGGSFKNRIINGAMMIDQRNAGASVSSFVSPYTLDRWAIYVSQTSKMTCQQNAGSVTPPVGFSNYMGITSSSAYSVVSGDYFFISQRIEGFNTADLAWGTASAATVTLSFKVYSSLTGTFGGSIQNSAQNRTYPFTYTVSSANTWTTVSVTIAGDTTGTWLTNSSTGIQVNFGLGVGSTYSGTAGSWGAGSFFSATGATSVVGTSGATFYITGVQLEKGFTATSFDYRPYGTELDLCYRYCFAWRTDASGYTQYGRFPVSFSTSTTNANTDLFLPTTMRTTAYSLTWNNKPYQEYLRTGGGATGTTIVLNTDSNGINWVNIVFTFTGTALPADNFSGIRLTNVTDGALIVSTEL